MKELFDDLIHKHSDNITIVAYLAEFGGSAVRRIITSHDEYYSEFENPLAFPNHLEGFKRHLDHFLDFKEQHLACAHTDDIPIDISWGTTNKVLGKDIDRHIKLFHQEQTKLLEENHKVCWRAHDDDPGKNFTHPTKIIRLYGRELDRFNKAARFNKKANRYHDTNYIPPTESEHVLNIESSKLFSLNYDDYLNEYLKLTTYLNVVPKVNSVRQFILLWLEKQERFKLTLS